MSCTLQWHQYKQTKPSPSPSPWWYEKNCGASKLSETWTRFIGSQVTWPVSMFSIDYLVMSEWDGLTDTPSPFWKFLRWAVIKSSSEILIVTLGQHEWTIIILYSSFNYIKWLIFSLKPWCVYAWYLPHLNLFNGSSWVTSDYKWFIRIHIFKHRGWDGFSFWVLKFQ